MGGAAKASKRQRYWLRAENLPRLAVDRMHDILATTAQIGRPLEVKRTSAHAALIAVAGLIAEAESWSDVHSGCRLEWAAVDARNRLDHQLTHVAAAQAIVDKFLTAGYSHMLPSTLKEIRKHLAMALAAPSNAECYGCRTRTVPTTTR